MLELGRGSRELPVLRDGEVVAVLRAAGWKEAATAVVGDREWVFTRRKRDLVGRLTADPEDAARLRAVQTSAWRGTWRADLDGVPVDVETVSWWKGTRRYTSGGRTVGEGGTTGGWSPRPTVTADDSLSLEAQVFLLWVQLVLDRRQTATTIAATTGGAAAAGSS
ncbi:hypothetical protein [Geodermatophilus sp. SYSU D00696]